MFPSIPVLPKLCIFGLNQYGVIDEKDLERARNDKGHFVADDPDTPENEAWVKKEEE